MSNYISVTCFDSKQLIIVKNLKKNYYGKETIYWKCGYS